MNVYIWVSQQTCIVAANAGAGAAGSAASAGAGAAADGAEAGVDTAEEIIENLPCFNPFGCR